MFIFLLSNFLQIHKNPQSTSNIPPLNVCIKHQNHRFVNIFLTLEFVPPLYKSLLEIVIAHTIFLRSKHVFMKTNFIIYHFIHFIYYIVYFIYYTYIILYILDIL